MRVQQPTEQSALNAAERIATSCVQAIGAPVRAVVLYGSLTTDDFVPGQSDIDLLVVVDGRLSDAEVHALTELVRSAELGGAGGLDLCVVTAEVAAAPTRTPPMQLQVGRYPGMALEVEARVDAAADLPAELSLARATGRALVGATPREAIGAVPADWLQQRGQHWVRAWQSLTDDQDNAQLMVLTACRIWRFGVEEVHGSKTEAGRWALARDPSLTAVAEALRQRTVDAGAPIGEAGIVALLATVQRELSTTTTAAP